MLVDSIGRSHNISNNQFNDFDEPVSEFERKTVIQIANTVV